MVTAIPTLFVGLFAGVFVDRFDKKRILLLANLLRGFIVLGIPLAYTTFMPGNQDAFVFALYGLIFISATVRQFFDPAWEAVLPEIATEEELTQANSFLAVSSFGSTAVGFAAAGFLASTGDYLLPFYIDAITYFVAFALLLPVRVRKRRRVRGGDLHRRGRRQPEERRAVPVADADPALASSWSARRSSCRSGCGTSCSCRWRSGSSAGREFEYGLQEGLTSVGFVIGSFFMAQARRPPRRGHVARRRRRSSWACSASFYGLSPNIAGRDRDGHDHRLPERAPVHRPPAAAAAAHPAGHARPRVLGDVRVARRAVPDRHGRRGPRRHLPGPRADRRLVGRPHRRRTSRPSSRRASAGRRPSGGKSLQLLRTAPEAPEHRRRARRRTCSTSTA